MYACFLQDHYHEEMLYIYTNLFDFFYFGLVPSFLLSFSFTMDTNFPISFSVVFSWGTFKSFTFYYLNIFIILTLGSFSGIPSNSLALEAISVGLISEGVGFP